MMRIRIEIVPHGNEEAAHTIHVINIGQTYKFDNDPYGRREYTYWEVDASLPLEDREFVEALPSGTVQHYRGDGAKVLASVVLQDLTL